MKICADPTELRRRSDDMKTIGTELRHGMESIEALVLSLNGAWQGEAERAYASRILFVKQEFADIMAFFDDCASLLASFAAQYEEQDSDLAAKINLT